MIPLFRAAALAAVAVALASCTNPFANPYALDIQELDYGAGRQRLATIQVSGPMPFKREELLNDRLAEDKYLEELLTESKTIKFEPELVRDIEVISAMSAQLGVSFDPTGGTKFARSKELSDIEQEIAVVKLRGQLAQAQRDVQLQQEALLKQTAPSAGFGGGAPSSTQLASTQPPGLADTAAALQQVNSLIDKAAARLDRGSSAPRLTTASASPRDTFRDRQAYRNELRSARNAVALDSQHDADGNTLFRYQFKATVLPGADTEDRLGIVRMTVLPPDLFFDRSQKDAERIGDEMTLRELYLEWLRRITVQLNEETLDGKATLSRQVRQLAADGELFRIIEYRYPKKPEDAEKLCKPGLVLPGVTLKDERSTKCGYVQLAVSLERYDAISRSILPRESFANEGGMLRDIEDLRRGIAALTPDARKNLPQCPWTMSSDAIARLIVELQSSATPRSQAALPSIQNRETSTTTSKSTGSTGALPQMSRIRPALAAVAQRAALAVVGASVSSDPRSALRNIVVGQLAGDSIGSRIDESEAASTAAAVNNLIDYLAENVEVCACDPDFRDALLISNPLYTALARDVREVPERFRRILTAGRLDSHIDGNADTVSQTRGQCRARAATSQPISASFATSTGRVNFAARGSVLAYAVSPAFLGQRVSTVARAADAIQLAASLAGAFPQAGVGASGSVGAGRLASGKADALERLPLVVGFTEPKLLHPLTNGQPRPSPTKSGGGMPGRVYQTGAFTSFGWLLGPRALIDPADKNLKLAHPLGDYDLTVDLSMPGWWPYIDLKVETLWAPNWRDGRGAMIEDDSAKSFTRTMRVRLSHTAADMDGLTEIVTRHALGPAPRTMEIQSVDPPAVSSCAESITLVARGTNLWRTTKAYLRGRPADDIKVLPDMSGVALKFTTNALPTLSPQIAVTGRLLLQSSMGQDEFNMKVTGRGIGSECKDTAPLKDSDIHLASIVPPVIRACWRASDQAIAQGQNLLESFEVIEASTAEELKRGKLREILEVAIKKADLSEAQLKDLDAAVQKLPSDLDVWPDHLRKLPATIRLPPPQTANWNAAVAELHWPKGKKIKVARLPSDAFLGMTKLDMDWVPAGATGIKSAFVYPIGVNEDQIPKLLDPPRPTSEANIASLNHKLVKLRIPTGVALFPNPDGTLPFSMRVGADLLTANVTIDTDHCDMPLPKIGTSSILGGEDGAVLNLCAKRPVVFVGGQTANDIVSAELKEVGLKALSVQHNKDDKVASLSFSHSGQKLPTTVSLETRDRRGKAQTFVLRTSCVPQEVATVRLFQP